MSRPLPSFDEVLDRTVDYLQECHRRGDRPLYYTRRINDTADLLAFAKHLREVHRAGSAAWDREVSQYRHAMRHLSLDEAAP